MAMLAPQRKLSLPDMTDVLILHENKTQAGIWGIGVTIGKIAPHTVLSVDCLIGKNNEDLNSSVEVGDLVYGVDDVMIEQATLESVETVVFGEIDTMCKLDLVSQRTGQHYTVEVKRHIPIRLWDIVLRWYELQKEYEGQDLLAESQIINTLEGIRRVVNDGSGNALDLLKDDRHVRSTLGIRMLPHGSPMRYGRYINPREVQGITPGGPAYLSGQILVGDEVVAVNGEPVEPDSAIEQVRGNDVIGARCVITLQRNGQIHNVELVRASATAVRAAEQLHRKVELLDELVRAGAPHATIHEALQDVIKQTNRMEQDRADRETNLSDKLNILQNNIFDGITTAEQMLHPLPSGDDDAMMMKKKQGGPAVQRSAPPPKDAPDDADVKVVKKKKVNTVQRSAPPKPPAPAPAADTKDLEDQLKKLQAENLALREEANRFAEINKKLVNEADSLIKENFSHQGEDDKLKDEMRKLREMLADANAAAAKAIAEANAANLESDRLREEKDRAQNEIMRCQQKLDGLTKSLSDQNSDNSRELDDEKAESDRLRQQCKQLRDQLKLLKDELETLQIRISTEMVPRTDWLLAVQQAKDAQNAATDLAHEVKGLKSELDSSLRELDNTKNRYQSVFEELQRLRQLVQQAGFSEDRELEKFATAMAGPPQVYVSEILSFLQLLQQFPKRSLADVRRIVEIMNEPQPWSAEDLARVRAIMRGPPPLTPSDLQKLISEYRGSPSLDDINKLQQDYHQLLAERSNFKNLEAENASLLDKLRALQDRLHTQSEMLAQAEEDAAQQRDDKERFAAQNGQLQKQIEKLQAHIKELEGELAALREKYANEHHKLLTPVHHPPGQQFETDTFDVILCCGVPGAVVYYTLDNTTPSPSNSAGTGPAPLKITLKESGTVQSLCIGPDGQTGNTSTHEYSKAVVKKKAAAPPPPERAMRSAPPPAQATRSAPPPPPGPPQVVSRQVPRALAGVGLLLERFDGDSRVFVKRLVPGTPADRGGQILVSDIIESVEGRAVEQLELDEIFKLVLGPEGTAVKFSIAREVKLVVPEPMFANEQRGLALKHFDVTLIRQHIMTHDELEHSYSAHPHPQNRQSSNNSFSNSYPMMRASSQEAREERTVYPAVRSPAVSVTASNINASSSFQARSPSSSPFTSEDAHFLHGLGAGFRNLNPTRI